MNFRDIKVGMIVEHLYLSFTYRVLYVGQTGILLVMDDGSEYFSYYTDDWIEIKPKKKPSERIKEIVSEIPREANYSSSLFYTICQFLDE